MQRLRASLCAALLLGAGPSGCSADDDDGDSQAASTETEAGSDTGEPGDAETGDDEAATAYCACMLINCHETYHGKWGDEELPAQQACITEAQGLPVNGSVVDAGNFFECRQHFCAMATDAACPTGQGCDACDAAIGDAVCI